MTGALMRRTDPRVWARLGAQLHDAARAARQVADDREPAPAGHSPGPLPTLIAITPPGDVTPGQCPRPRKDGLPMNTPQPPHPLHALTTYELARYRRELEH